MPPLSAPSIQPPFLDPEQAARKVQLAEDLWNTRDPHRVAAAYTEDCVWRNRVEFLEGRDQIVAFLERKWRRELDYRPRKELWGFRNHRMAVKFHYQWRDDSGQWFRSDGNELWEFAPQRPDAAPRSQHQRHADPAGWPKLAVELPGKNIA